jgi:hypothetical protein
LPSGSAEGKKSASSQPDEPQGRIGEAALSTKDPDEFSVEMAECADVKVDVAPAVAFGKDAVNAPGVVPAPMEDPPLATHDA